MIGTIFNWVFMILNVIAGAATLATYDTHHSKIWLLNVAAVAYLARVIDSDWRAVASAREKH